MFQVQTNSLEVGRQIPLGEELWYASIFDEMDEVVWSIDANTNEIVYLNRAAEKLYGREIQAFYTNPELRLEVIIPEARNRVRDYLARVGKEKNQLETVYQIIKPSGEIRIVKDKTWAIADEEGKAQRIISLVKDITENVKYQEEHLRFQKLTANLPGIIYQYILHLDGRQEISYISPSCQEIYEIAPEAIQENINLIWDIVHPEDINNLQETIAISAETLQFWQCQWRIITQSGKLKWLSGVAQPEKQANGEIVWDGIFIDVSDRKKIEKERNELIVSMAKGEARYRSVLSAMSDGIIVQDTEGLILECNTSAERILGLTGEQIMGMKTLSAGGTAIAEDGSPLSEAEQPLTVTRKTGKPITNAVMGIAKPDRPITWILVNTQILLSPGSKKFSGIVASIKDITELHQAQKALKISTERLQLALEAANDGLWDWNLVTGELYLSDRWKQILGYNQSEIVNSMDSWQKLLHSEDLQVVLNLLEDHLAGNSPDFQAEYRMQTKSGDWKWILARGKVVESDFAGKPLRIIGTQRDISDRKAAEFALRHSQHQLEEAQRISRIGNWEYDLTTEQVTWSEELFRIFGLDPQQGAPSYSELIEKYHPEDRSIFQAKVEKAITEGKPYQLDLRFYRSDGELRYIVGWGEPVLNAEGTVVRLFGAGMDITERKQGELAIARSEARYRELAQREALLNRLSCLIRNSLDLDTILETTVREIYNHLQVDICAFGWYRYELVEPVWEIFKEAKHPATNSILGTYPVELYRETSVKLLQLETYQLDDINTAGDLALRELLTSLGATAFISLPIATTSGCLGSLHCLRCGENQPWQTKDLELLQAVATQLAIAINQAFLYNQSREATRQAEAKTQQLEQTLIELQRTQAQLVQTEKMSSLGQMVAGVAHEINNPVSFIYGNISHAIEYTADLLKIIELYQDTYPQPTPEIEAEITATDLEFLVADLPKVLDSMKVGAVRIKEIVQSLRTFSRLDEAEMKAVDLHENIDSTIVILQNRLKAKSDRPEIIVKKNYGNLPKVECCAGQLNQVFMNLIGNAIDALEERSRDRTTDEIKAKPSTISISTLVLPSNRVQIRIADNGNGMNPETIARIFDPFYTTKPIGKGTGLGLSISHSIIVEKHSGSLRCVSELGVGTEFAIEIPIHPPS
ncbi:MAG: PAS domain-containing protein [Oscillatoria sp. PMC 1051.18]|nr:PAS domain-containing protein [Oscillatoria sp. PMC 1050.18]MEC5028799.1 PAS domain-containing protein [Oscillatoria sp. PMC 1051.18]